MNRYNRHIVLNEIGQSGQDKITNAKVLVIGAGGLGCPVLQYLTAAGVGTIGIIDFDVVELSNLQRQVLFGKSSLGKNKAIAAKARLQDLNDDINIIAYSEQLTFKNAIQLFEDYDIIVDGSDNFETRYLVNDACLITNKPLVFSAIYKFEGQVSVFNYKNGPSYRCLFSSPPKKEAIPNCSEVGVLGVLPGIIGSLQANEVLKIILEIGDVLSGKLLCYNALTSQTTTLKINRKEEAIETVLKNNNVFKNQHLNSFCSTQEDVITLNNLNSIENIQFIDIREPNEFPKVENLKVISIPLSQLKENLTKIKSDQKIILFCQSGQRSNQAISILKNAHFKNCFSLKEGAIALKNHLNLISNER